MSDDLSLKPLEDALESLKDILAQPVNEYIRDGVIQRFEFTFELCWKTLKRYFKLIGRQDLSVGPRPILREAGKAGVISNVDVWLNFLEQRNISTHIYNQMQAEQVYAEAKKFPIYVEELLKNLHERKNHLK